MEVGDGENLAASCGPASLPFSTSPSFLGLLRLRVAPVWQTECCPVWRSNLNHVVQIDRLDGRQIKEGADLEKWRFGGD